MTTEMMSVKASSYRKDGDFIRVYEDKEGKNQLFALPVWMFNQMVEQIFNVKVQP